MGVTILLESETYFIEKLLHCRADTITVGQVPSGILMLYVIIAFCCQLNVMSTHYNHHLCGNTTTVV